MYHSAAPCWDQGFYSPCLTELRPGRKSWHILTFTRPYSYIWYTHMTWYFFWWSLWGLPVHPVWLHFCFCHAVENSIRYLSEIIRFQRSLIWKTLQCRWGCVEGRQTSPELKWIKNKVISCHCHACNLIDNVSKRNQTLDNTTCPQNSKSCMILRLATARCRARPATLRSRGRRWSSNLSSDTFSEFK